MTMAMERYSEVKRDRVERQLAAEANRRELIEEQRADLILRVYWLKLTNQVSMSLYVDNSEFREFLIPNEAVLDARDHPETYAARAGLPRRERMDN